MLHGDDLALLIPICALLIPIVAILTGHQRKMAEIVNRNNIGQQYNPEIAALRNEVAELKQLVHQQAIAMDNLVSLQTRATPVESQSLQNRIQTGA